MFRFTFMVMMAAWCAMAPYTRATDNVIFGSDSADVLGQSKQSRAIAREAVRKMGVTLVRVVRQIDEQTIEVEPVAYAVSSAELGESDPVTDADIELPYDPAPGDPDDHISFFGIGVKGITYSIRLSNPQVVSASFGVVIGKMWEAYYTHTYRRGVLIEGEVGVGGIKGSVGYFREGVFLIAPVAMAVKGSVLRTWWQSVFNDPGQTYLGGEVDLMAAFMKFSVGFFKRVRGDGEHDDWIVSGGIGVWF